MLTQKDLTDLKNRGITPDGIDSQIERFKTGFPYLRLLSSATIGNGILRLSTEDEALAQARWDKYLADGGQVLKFVPASGAASRMFKALFEFLNGADEIPVAGTAVCEMFENLDTLPFISQLNDVVRNLYGFEVKQLVEQGRYKDVVSALINPQGMNYGALPKGLLLFHKYEDTVHTPLEEQMAEGAQTAAIDGVVNLHFTVSSNHRHLFEDKIKEVQPKLENMYGVKYNISLSEQKPSTDTIAVNPDNTFFRNSKGDLVFRPGGHGALIENLNDIDSTVVFIKNIDNVVPDSKRHDTNKYKRILAGVLIEAHDSISKYLELLNSGNYTIEDLRIMIQFLHDRLNVRHEEMKHLEDAELALFLKKKFNRPLRVCGMVRNDGEPGGGPFIAYDADGSTSPQILESTQIDMSVPENVKMLERATHFNPVDLVCYIKDVDGNKFNLRDYVDKSTGFISSKSAEGRELRALELPGLWNGAMSDWSTIFVEVPSTTFNPVKTVNDLLRPAHQG